LDDLEQTGLLHFSAQMMRFSALTTKIWKKRFSFTLSAAKM